MIYTIFDKTEPVDRLAVAEDSTTPVAIPESVAPWALIAPPFWLVLHRLWWPLAFYLAFVALGLSLLATPLAPVAFFIAGLPGLFLWLEGWELVRRRLEREQFALVAVVEADGEESAIAHYLQDLPTAPRVQAADASPAQSTLPMPPAAFTANQMFGPFGAREA